MLARDLAPSPLARLLLELADRHADGSFDVGGRRFVLHRGSVATISAGDRDEDLGQFLVRAGLLDAGASLDLERKARELNSTLSDVVVRERIVRLEKLLEAERAFFLDRFVRSIAIAESEKSEPPPFVNGKLVGDSHTTYPLVPLMLDAFTKLAAQFEAAYVGERADHRVELLASPFQTLILDWFGHSINVDGTPIASLLSRDPSTAPRIAALVRVGVARLVHTESEAPAPPPRPNTLAPSDAPPREVTRSYPPSSAPERLSSIPPPRAADVVLGPGDGDSTSVDASEIATALKAYSYSEPAFEDPLDVVEASIRRLEQAGAEGALRAVEWKVAAELWQTRYLSVEEASRALREAAAADPKDKVALVEAARLCASLGDTRLACAYARSAASVSRSDTDREIALSTLAHYARLLGDSDAAITALRSATTAEDASARVFEELADLLVAAGEHGEAAECVRAAGDRVSETEPARARCLYTYAATLSAPTDEHIRAMVRFYERGELHEAALSYMATVARGTESADQARQLRLDAAGMAESLARPDLASELLTEAFDAEPHLEFVYEPLVADLEAAEAHEDLVAMIEDIAASTEDGRDAWLKRVETQGRVSTSIGPYEAAAQKLRRAQRGRDPVLARDAYALRAELAKSARTKSRALTGLARTLALLGDAEGAAVHAHSALDVDAHNADAARVLLQTFRSMPPDAAHRALDAARTALGDSRDLFRFLIETAQRAGDAESMRRSVDAWCEVEPTFPEALKLRFQVAREGDDVERLRLATLGILTERAITTHTATLVSDALARLVALAAPDVALQLGLFALDRLGADKRPLLDAVTALAAESDDKHAAIRAFERALGPALAEERVPWLARIARLHREQGDVAAEARTHLRILTTSIYDPSALTRLAEIYASTGQGEKLLAVLGLMLEATEDREKRMQILLDLAAAANAVARDSERAKQYIDSLFQEAGGDAVWSLRAAGALVAIGAPAVAVERLVTLAETQPNESSPRLLERAIAIAELAAGDGALALRTAGRALAIAPRHAPLLLRFERLALAHKELDLADSVYGDLVKAAYGPQTRRALFYRSARFFERAHDLRRAQTSYSAAFNEAPSAGAVFNSIERLSHSLLEFAPLTDSLMVLADRSPHPDTQSKFRRRAADVFTQHLRDPMRAFDVLMRNWEASPNADREREARNALAAVLKKDPAEGEAARARFVAALEQQANEAWDGEAKGRWLLGVARVTAVEETGAEKTRAAVEKARTAFLESPVEPDSEAAFLCDAAEILAAWPSERAEARRLVGDALFRAPRHERALALATELSVPTPSLAPGADAPVSRAPTLTPTPDVIDGIEAAFATITTPSERPETFGLGVPVSPHLAISPSHVRDVMASGDNDRAVRLAEELSIDPTRAHEASRLLQAVVVRDPSRTDALRGLYHLSRGRGANAEADMLAGFVSLFDSNVSRPSASIASEVDADLHAALAADVHARAFAKVWTTVWESALHLYRKPLQAYHVFGTDRITHLVQNPVAQAFFGAARTLDATDVPLFGRRMGAGELIIARTAPPSVIIGPTLDGDEPELMFRFGRALTLARPSHLLIATLDDAEGRALTSAVAAAFGPPSNAAPKDAKTTALAAELWRIMPPRAQRELRDQLAAISEPLEYDAARMAVFAQAARAGLLASGDSHAAALALRPIDPVLQSADLSTESGWIAACQRSHVLRELVRFALSPAWLSAIAVR